MSGIRDRWGNFVGGEYIDPRDGAFSHLIDPVNGEVFTSVPLSKPEDVDHACQVAEKAFEVWRETTPSERSLALLRIADAVERRGRRARRRWSAENTGKPIAR